MPTTSNFGWTTPADTDLVKDGAAAIRTLGNGIDTSMAQLKGGTTGQVLSKTSNTDMAFTWVTQDDANAIQNAIVDAKGDLITATANDTPARLAVGSNGDTLVADSASSTGLRWQSNFAAGKNAIINGDFRINQRAFSSTTTSGTYGFDRWKINSSGGTVTYSAQTFTAGAAPVAGYEAINFAQIVVASQTTSGQYAYFQQPVEDVRVFAGQTVTLSFWAKVTSGTASLWTEINQDFGSGGSSQTTNAAGTASLTTSWTRFSHTITLPSLSGKTIGTGNNLQVAFWPSAGSAIRASYGLQNNTFQIWGVQLEAGSVATAFQTATGTLAGELAAAQRYYWRTVAGSAYGAFGIGLATTTTDVRMYVQNPVPMRVAPTSMDSSALAAHLPGVSITAISSVGIGAASPTGVDVAAAGTGFTAYRPYLLSANNNSNAYIGFSAEL